MSVPAEGTADAPPPAGQLVHVYLPRACFGVVVDGDRVVWSAPYGRRFLMGLTSAELRLKVRSLGGHVTVTPPRAGVPTDAA